MSRYNRTILLDFIRTSCRSGKWNSQPSCSLVESYRIIYGNPLNYADRRGEGCVRYRLHVRLSKLRCFSCFDHPRRCSVFSRLIQIALGHFRMIVLRSYEWIFPVSLCFSIYRFLIKPISYSISVRLIYINRRLLFCIKYSLLWSSKRISVTCFRADFGLEGHVKGLVEPAI